jgi:dTDP-4-amino-4,6-dideoxygalactose transaminase
LGAPPFLLPADPKANYLAHKDEIDQAIDRVLNSGWYVLGQEVDAFEQEFARYLGVRYAIGVGSGTDALHVALRACGIGPGHTVITVSHTAVATVAAIELAGATPVLIDINPMTFTMDPNDLEDSIKEQGNSRRSAVSGRLKAIIPVHLYGHPADMPSIMDLARRYGLYVIEDCAQSHGAAIQGCKTGAWGHLAAFSFYPTKNLGALGDGGAVVTSDPDLAERVRLLREYGWRQRYISELQGMNTRLDEIQAAILRVKLPYLDGDNARRQRIAAAYSAALSSTSLRLPEAKSGAGHVYHQYAVRSERRGELQVALKQAGIGTAILYPEPVHRQPAYQERLAHGVGGLYQSERVCREILCLPMHPHLSDDEVARVAEAAIAATQ